MRLNRAATAQRLGRVLARTQIASPSVPTALSVRRAPDEASPPRAPWTDSPTGRRRNQRVERTAAISVRRIGGIHCEARLGDLSTGGCKVARVGTVAVNDRVIARLPGLEPFAATVTWTDEHTAGLSFERPMHPAVLDQLLSRLG